MKTIYGTELANAAIAKRFKYLINQIYKLLPLREEGGAWKDLLDSLLEELDGMMDLVPDMQEHLLPIVCKLQGLSTADIDFMRYRKVIFESLNLLGGIVTNVLG